MRNIFLSFSCLLAFVWQSKAALPTGIFDPLSLSLSDTIPALEERFDDFISKPNNNPFDLHDPSIIEQSVEYDPLTDQYIIYEKIGDEYFRTPTYMTFSEYVAWRAKRSEKNYFLELGGMSSPDKSTSDKVDPISKVDLSNVQNNRVKDMLERSLSGKVDPLAKINLENKLIDRLFGGTKVEIRPQGNIDLTFGGDYSRFDNFNLPPRARRQGGFDFDMDIQMNVVGQIGDKMKLNTNYNTLKQFDFENIMKLDYNTTESDEDAIVKSIEAGNVSLPLKGQLIQGAQSLFGLKTELQFGYLRITALASQQNSQRDEIQIQGGSQITEYRIQADQYDENRHFFLSHYFRDGFEPALYNLPQVKTLYRLQNLEVWVTNERNDFQNTRQILALTDLGEYERLTSSNVEKTPGHLDFFGEELPLNASNDLYGSLKTNPNARYADRVVSILQTAPYNFQQGKDFEVVTARKLDPTEYEVDPDLGYISLKINLRPDQVLAASYNYTYRGENASGNDLLKVGEFRSELGEDSVKILVTKLLKSTTPRVDVPMWDLMMKNIYNIGAYNADSLTFKFDIFYEDAGGGEKRFLPEAGFTEKPLLTLFNMDNLNVMRDPQPDGVFDYVPGLTIRPQTGRIMFPVLEPFGSSLTKKLDTQKQKDKYGYQQLYDSTLFRAQEFQELNRFVMKGSYKSSVSSEISLGTFNLPPGSVTVTAGGRILVEGQDYDINYSTGQIKILNDAILQQGAPIRVSFEDNAMFGLQMKTMLGLRADYQLSKDMTVGATFLKLFERPYTQKVNVGEDPINNNIYGFDFNYNKEAPWLTKAVDRLPFIETKAPSSITLAAETAFIDPGHSRAINLGDDKSGSVYIDDFEGSVSPLSLITSSNQWAMASIPRNDNANNNPLFPESNPSLSNNLLSGVNRGNTIWSIDIFDRLKNAQDKDTETSPYTNTVNRSALFPNQSVAPGQLNQLRTFDMTFFPRERGPYNFDLPGGTQYSAGLANNGDLQEPQTRWGGIMRSLTFTDFEQSNVEFMEFWMLDPTITNPNNPGKLIINLGNISEDILPDSRQFFENGLPGENDPASQEVTTNWGRVPVNPPLTNGFDNGSEVTRELQDSGLDGLLDSTETTQYADYLSAITNSTLNQAIKDSILKDPARDNFVSPDDFSFEGTSLFDKLRRFNAQQGNTPIRSTNTSAASPTQYPDAEDLNNDRTLNQSESYYQYEIPIEHDAGGGLRLNQYITDTMRIPGTDNVWYRFKVPIDQYTGAVGGIQGFRAIRFIRLYATGFDDQVTFRFAQFDLVRNQWRRYKRNLNTPGVTPVTEDDLTTFDVNAVNIEENGGKVPFKYTLPRGIARERSLGAFPNLLQNEQSLSMTICGLKPNNARAIFKIMNLDMRVYERMKMFVHAESPDNIETGDLSLFVRVGSDYENNYYEYELPLSMSLLANLPPNPNPNSDEYVDEVWKSVNGLDIPLSLFTEAKLQRNAQKIPSQNIYTITDPDKPEAKVRIKGNPNLGLVKGIMVGVRNNDNFNHCVEVWLNELRLHGLDERGGAAALVRSDVKMADFGQVTLSGGMSTIGFGALDKRLAQRSREQIYEYGGTGQVELGMVFPEKTGIKLPFFAQYNTQVRTPQFDPYDLDLELKEKVATIPDRTERDSVRRAAQTVQTVRSYNFTNVRKERTADKTGKPMPWDIENFALSYAYTETDRRDPIIESNNEKLYRGGLDYAWSRQAKPWQPFKKAITKDKYVKFITEFNINPLPNSFAFNSNLDRQFSQSKYRFTGGDAISQYNTFYVKRFTWDRNYDLQWDFAKSLKFNFTANNRSLIDEPYEFRPDGAKITTQERNDSIWTNIQNLGRTKAYGHEFSLDYNVPLKNFPFLDFAKVTARVGATYDWAAASLNVDTLGNVMQNSQTRQINGDFNLETLYNKVPYLKQINTGKVAKGGKTPTGKTPPAKGTSRGEDGGDTSDDDGGGKVAGGGRDAASGERESRKDRKEKEKTRDESTAPDGMAGGAEGRPGRLGPDGRPIGGAADGAKTGAAGAKAPKDKKDKVRQPSATEIALVRPLMSLRTVKFRYSENFGSVVPGYVPDSKLLGMASNFTAPGWGYVAGFQPTTAYLDEAAAKGWFTKNPCFNDPIQTRYTQDISANATLEPIKEFKIEVDAVRKYTRNHNEFFLFYPNGEGYQHRTPQDMGSFTVSYFSMRTMFKDSNQELIDLFSSYENNRAIISKRLGVDPHPVNPGYTEGYGRTNQDVLAPAFLATYSGTDPNKINTDLFQTMPMPNWRVTYNGLSKLEAFKETFQSINITHGYKSTLQVNAYQTNPNYLVQNPYRTNDNSDYYALFEIPAIVITEQFAPLIGVDIKLKNSMSIRGDMKKSRTLSMGFSDFQLNETKSTEYTFGFSYRKKDVDIPFLTKLVAQTQKPIKKADVKDKAIDENAAADKPKKTKKAAGNDLTMRCDFSYKDDVTFIHQFDIAGLEPTRGAKTLSLAPSVEYILSKKLTLRTFVNYNLMNPRVSNSFKTINMDGGLTVRFTL